MGQQQKERGIVSDVPNRESIISPCGENGKTLYSENTA
jgi:hypothetical protein